MKTQASIIILSLCLISFSIKIPLQQNEFKCMLLYSMGEDQTVKLDINFPKVKFADDDVNEDEQVERYLISLRNTITGDIKSDSLQYFGVFKKEISVHSKVIYEVCFELLSDRKISEQIVVEYNADIHYVVNHDAIKIPEHLLKTHELQKSYENAIQLHQLADKLIDLQHQRHKHQKNFFAQTTGKDGSIITITVFEMLLIFGISAVQLFGVKKYFDQVNPALF